MVAFFSQYFIWHYTEAFRQAFDIWKTFLWFSLHVFRVKLHIRTFFYRFNRLGEEYSSMGFDIGKIASVLLINTIMRIVGMLFRLVVIVSGVISWLVVLMGGLIFFAVWTIYPVLVTGLFIFGGLAFVL